jgi:hypothetical protein
MRCGFKTLAGAVGVAELGSELVHLVVSYAMV